MGGWVGGWVDGWVGGLVGRAEVQERGTYEEQEIHVIVFSKWVDGWMGGWMGGWVGGWVDGWMDGWVGRSVGRAEVQERGTYEEQEIHVIVFSE